MKRSLKSTALTICSSIFILAALSPQALAATQRSADFDAGNTVGLGLYGLSYDYGLGWFSVGLAAQSSVASTLGNPLADPIQLSTRMAGRFYEEEGLSAAVIAGLYFDPGQPGSRAYLTPDLGLSVAYDFREHNFPFALRLNLSLAISDRTSYYPVSEDYAPKSNFFQKLSFGPGTSLELAWMPTDNFEVTLGGGTLLGMRLKF